MAADLIQSSTPCDRPTSPELPQGARVTELACDHLMIPDDVTGAPSAYLGPTGFNWLIRGRLGGAPCPGGVASLDDDLTALRRVGVDFLYTLTEEWEAPVEIIKAHGIDCARLSVPDMGAPSLAEADAACEQVSALIAAGRTVAFHCRAGRGRTGTLLAAQLIWWGKSDDEAVSRTRRNCRTWIESDKQLHFLKEFSRHRQRFPLSRSFFLD